MTTRGLLCVLAMMGCATAPPPRAQPIAPSPAPAATTLPAAIEIEVVDDTRKQAWLDEIIADELQRRGVKVSRAVAADASARYVLHVRVPVRSSDHGMAVEKAPKPVGTRLDDAGGPEQEAFRDAPVTETPAYDPKQGTAAKVLPTEAVDDFRVTTTATLTKKGDATILAKASFDEGAFGLATVPRDQRGKEWQSLYRGAAIRIVGWLQSQSLP